MAETKKKHVKVPMIMQMEALECGAACLAMVLAYYKKWIPLSQVREDCGVSRDGSFASSILKAARNYGMNAKAYKYSVEKLKTRVTYPAIIHWNFNHFVVLAGFKGDRAVINDPARGIVEVSPEELDRSFTGVCMQFVPGENFRPSGKQASLMNFLASHINGIKKPLFLIALTATLAALIGIVTPVFSRIFLDEILTGNNPEWLMPFNLILLAVILYWTVVLIIQKRYYLKVEGKIAIASNSEYMWHTLHLPMKFFSQRMCGDLAGRQNLNDSIAQTLVTQLAPIFINIILLIFYLIVMFVYSPLLASIGLVTIAINLWVTRVISAKRMNLTRVQMRDQAKMDSSTVSGIQMIETIQAAGAEEAYFERWSGYQASVNKAKTEFTKLNQFLGAVPAMVQQVSSIVILSLGIWMIMDGHFSVGMLTAFQGFMSSFLQPVNTLLTAGQSIQELRTSMERIDDVMDYETDVKTGPEIREDVSYQKLEGTIELKDITFGYSKVAPPLIENFNLTIHAGEKIAIVGGSGCGKSTISKVIAGLYEPWSGEVLFDGRHREEIPRSVFNGSLAVVDQDITLFEDTISENIKMWDQTIEDFEVIMAARDAKIHEDIMLKKNGYQYRVAENGKNLSGGQRQRLELARVLALDPTILILDEATSALDAQTEGEVIRAIKMRGITSIIVAHRLSTIRDCDQILVMQDGHIVEQGTHEELMKLNGYYTQLITTE